MIDVETDIIVGLLSSNLNEAYRPLLSLSCNETEKSKNLHLIIKVIFNLTCNLVATVNKNSIFLLAKDTLVWQKFRGIASKTIEIPTEYNVSRTRVGKC